MKALFTSAIMAALISSTECIQMKYAPVRRLQQDPTLLAEGVAPQQQMQLFQLDAKIFQKSSGKLPKMKTPFLPEKKTDDPPYSLVLDLDETLVHTTFKNNGEINFATRPYLEQFLSELSKDYEISIFTAGMQDYADSILNDIDKKGNIKHRMYRQHCQTNNPFMFIKDMRKIGRDLHKSIIIDDRKENYESTSPDNGINIKAWINDKNDTELKRLLPFLQAIAENKEKDVRTVLRKYKTEPEKYLQQASHPGHKHHHQNL